MLKLKILNAINKFTMKRKVRDYFEFDGFKVSCMINKTVIDDGMIVFADDHMFIFQNQKGGGSPADFNKINRERFVDYAGSWDCGDIEGNVIPSVTMLEILGQGYKKFDIKIDDKFYDENKNVYSVFKKYDRDSIVLLKNNNGDYCKMLTLNELKSTFIYEKDENPKLAVKPDYYFEDLLAIIQERNKKFNFGGAKDLLGQIDGKAKSKLEYLANIFDADMRAKISTLMDEVLNVRRGQPNLTWEMVYREAVEKYFINVAEKKLKVDPFKIINPVARPVAGPVANPAERLRAKVKENFENREKGMKEMLFKNDDEDNDF